MNLWDNDKVVAEPLTVHTFLHGLHAMATYKYQKEAIEKLMKEYGVKKND